MDVVAAQHVEHLDAAFDRPAHRPSGFGRHDGVERRACGSPLGPKRLEGGRVARDADGKTGSGHVVLPVPGGAMLGFGKAQGVFWASMNFVLRRSEPARREANEAIP